MEYLWLLAAYLLGAIPFGYLMVKLVRNVDVRQYGSGNIGTTNVMRLLGTPTAALVLLLDVGKGVVSVLVPWLVWDSMEIMLFAAFLVVLGHCYPVFLRFSGGKGAATGIGVMLSIPGFALPFIIVLLIAGALIGLTRYVSLGSISASGLVPIFFWIWGYSTEYVILGVALAALIIWRHRENLVRLIRGTEKKLGEKETV